jgi:isoamylase
MAFTQQLIALRRRFPILHNEHFFTGACDEPLGARDITWLTPASTEMVEANWRDGLAKCIGVLLDARAARPQAEAAMLLLILNSHHDVVDFVLPEVAGGAGWQLLLDTNASQRGEAPVSAFGETYPVTGRSLLLFELRPAHEDKATPLPATIDETVGEFAPVDMLSPVIG